MACTWGSKVNGILTVFAIGVAVLIDLWDLLDHKKGNTMARLISISIDCGLKSFTLGPFLETLYREGNWVDYRAFRHLPVFLLHPLRYSHTIWAR